MYIDNVHLACHSGAPNPRKICYQSQVHPARTQDQHRQKQMSIRNMVDEKLACELKVTVDQVDLGQILTVWKPTEGREMS